MYRVAATASRTARTTNTRFFSSVRASNALYKHLLSTLNAVSNASKNLS